MVEGKFTLNKIPDDGIDFRNVLSASILSYMPFTTGGYDFNAEIISIEQNPAGEFDVTFKVHAEKLCEEGPECPLSQETIKGVAENIVTTIEDNVESGDLVTKINDEATKMNFDPVVKAAGVIFASDPTYTITDDKTTLSPTPPPTLPSTPPPTPAPLPRQTTPPPMSTNAVSKLSLGDQQQSTAGGKAMIVIVMLMPFLLAIGVFLSKKKKQNNATNNARQQEQCNGTEVQSFSIGNDADVEVS